jgi:hypothetical protein
MTPTQTRWLNRSLRGAQLLGIDVFRARESLYGLPQFVRTLREYLAAPQDDRFPVTARNLVPILSDFRSEAGVATGHYFHQDLWAARGIHEAKPHRHVDVGSRIDGFVAHVLTFMPVQVVDIRPLYTNVTGLEFVQDDGTALKSFSDASVVSLSSLHALEHFGLGRYGDEVDPDGWRKGMRALARVLAPGGALYLSVPLGRQRLEFNGHRVFDPKTVLDTMSDLSLTAFAAVDDAGDFHQNSQPSDFASARMACGLFRFSK